MNAAVRERQRLAAQTAVGWAEPLLMLLVMFILMAVGCLCFGWEKLTQLGAALRIRWFTRARSGAGWRAS
jgi:hypothetical protein